MLVVCNSTQIFVDKAGMVKPDMVEEGLWASLGVASDHLRGHEMCSEIRLAEAYDGYDILLEVDLRDWLTAFAVFACASSIC